MLKSRKELIELIEFGYDIKEIIKKEIWFNSFVINDIEPPSKTKLMI